MKKGLFLFLVLAVAFSAGCANLNKKDKDLSSGPAMLEPQSILKFSDVPAPVGFKLILKESYSFENSGIRVALLKYQGKANADQVTNFYKEQLAMYNWNLLNVIEYGDRQLNFERDSETCVITLIPKGAHMTAIIAIGPKSQYLKGSGKNREERAIK